MRVFLLFFVVILAVQFLQTEGRRRYYRRNHSPYNRRYNRRTGAVHRYYNDLDDDYNYNDLDDLDDDYNYYNDDLDDLDDLY
ncbi:unnamed protein product [Nippostrongylus brasiliensis]|uniref:M148R n=1 Tax=Nippostrongylus brasiliensis TaxID=27835 RepID=A0A0N4XG18_NIPBR|nr:unnamed protein product [Nippostrongylus brasiliensis]